MSYTPKILSSESVCFEGSIFRKCYRGTYVPKVQKSDRWSNCVMFDDPTALRSNWHDSTALGKYLFVPSMCNNSFCRVKFPNCLKHNISIQMSIQSINDEWWVYIIMDPHYSNNIFIPPPNEVGGGGILDSPCPSVRRYVCPSVCRRHGFRSISQVCFGISISNFICMLMVAIGRSLLIFSDVTFKMAAWRLYWIFWFPDSNFTLALNINFKLQRHNTYVYG